MDGSLGVDGEYPVEVSDTEVTPGECAFRGSLPTTTMDFPVKGVYCGHEILVVSLFP